MSWASKKGFIKTDPIAGRVDLPRPVLRGREARMSEELMDLLIGEARSNKMKSQEFADLLWVLRVTGARPGEIRAAEAFNYEAGKLVFRWNATRGYLWKNAKKTQRDRIIYLTPEVQAHVEKLVAATPKGPIFRTPRNATWSPTSLHKWHWLVRRPRVVEYCQQHGIEVSNLKPYNFRHSAISSWVDRAGDIYVAAQVFGTSVKMVETRYGHPNIDLIHAKVLQFHKGAA